MSARPIEQRAGASRMSAAAQAIRAFYSRPVAWLALFVTSAMLAYGGGGAMFWFHAIYRGEDGPPINDWCHWLFDSTLGFVALTPALFFILPATLATIRRLEGRLERPGAIVYTVLVGVAFGVVTGPGPLLHNALVGREAPLGRLATDIFGRDPAVAARVVGEHSALSDVLLQVAVGVPVYVAAGLLALGLVRLIASWRSSPR